MIRYYYHIFETPLGWMGAIASSRGLRRTTLPQPSPNQCADILGSEADEAIDSREHFERLRDMLLRYFDAEPITFINESIDVNDASRFLRAAWSACRSIPLGETRTYKWLAVQMGMPQAPRMVGQCMARNRLPIIIPCHRVIASDGGLGGFGDGATQLDLRRRLLQLEAPYTNQRAAYETEW